MRIPRKFPKPERETKPKEEPAKPSRYEFQPGGNTDKIDPKEYPNLWSVPVEEISEARIVELNSVGTYVFAAPDWKEFTYEPEEHYKLTGMRYGRSLPYDARKRKLFFKYKGRTECWALTGKAWKPELEGDDPEAISDGEILGFVLSMPVEEEKSKEEPVKEVPVDPLKKALATEPRLTWVEYFHEHELVVPFALVALLIVLALAVWMAT